MEIPECEYREPLPEGARYHPDTPVEKRTIVCSKIRDVLGWGHGIPLGHCVRCMADSNNPQSARASINIPIVEKMLKARITRFFDWDNNEQKKKILTKNLSQVIGTAKEWLGERRAAQVLVEGTRNGISLDKATGFAREHFSE